ncbi:MAG: acyltransferase [Brumimicrobium sp.]
MNEQQPAYLKALTFPRFILAILIVVFHFGMHLSFFKENYFAELFQHGAVAVNFFFFLSGFVLAYNYGTSTSTKRFLLKRIFRIYPIYFITFFAVLITSIGFGRDLPTLFHGAMNLIGLQSWFPGYALEVNGPSWSISVEFFLYATFPILLWVFRKVKWTSFVLISLLIIITGWVQHYYFVEHLYEPNRYFLAQFINHFPLFHFSTFVAGFLCGKWVFQLKKVNVNSWYFTLLATLGILGFILVMNFENLIRPYTHNGGLIPFFAMICIGLALDKNFYHHVFGSKPFIYLGNISYGVYMWQFPLFIWFSYLVGTELLTSSEFILYLLLLLVWSSLSYELIEKPARKYLNRKFL